MVFAYDTEAALGNTGSTLGEDALASLTALQDLVATYGWTGTVRGDATEFASVRALRPRLRGLREAVMEDLAEKVDALIAESAAMPRLVAHDGRAHHLHATADDAPLAVHMAVEAAMAKIDVVRNGETERLGVCAADGCTGVLADFSRNRSRRQCSTSRANRVNVAAYRARQP